MLPSTVGEGSVSANASRPLESRDTNDVGKSNGRSVSKSAPGKTSILWRIFDYLKSKLTGRKVIIIDNESIRLPTVKKNKLYSELSKRIQKANDGVAKERMNDFVAKNKERTNLFEEINRDLVPSHQEEVQADSAAGIAKQKKANEIFTHLNLLHEDVVEVGVSAEDKVWSFMTTVVQEDRAFVVDWCKQNATKGCPDSIFYLGKMSSEGYTDGVPKFDKLALDLFKRAAKGGSAATQNMLGKIYKEDSLGQKINAKKSQAFYADAIKQNHPMALFDEAGRFVDMATKGVRTSRHAAVNNGQSMPSNVIAYSLYYKAAKLKVVPAYYELGILEAKRREASESTVKVPCYETGAELGCAKCGEVVKKATEQATKKFHAQVAERKADTLRRKQQVGKAE